MTKFHRFILATLAEVKDEMELISLYQNDTDDYYNRKVGKRNV